MCHNLEIAMNNYPDLIEFAVSFLILATLSFVLLFCGMSLEALTLQACIIVAAVADVILFAINWDD